MKLNLVARHRVPGTVSIDMNPEELARIGRARGALPFRGAYSDEPIVAALRADGLTRMISTRGADPRLPAAKQAVARADRAVQAASSSTAHGKGPVVDELASLRSRAAARVAREEQAVAQAQQQEASRDLAVALRDQAEATRAAIVTYLTAFNQEHAANGLPPIDLPDDEFVDELFRAATRNVQQQTTEG